MDSRDCSSYWVAISLGCSTDGEISVGYHPRSSSKVVDIVHIGALKRGLCSRLWDVDPLSP